MALLTVFNFTTLFIINYIVFIQAPIPASNPAAVAAAAAIVPIALAVQPEVEVYIPEQVSWDCALCEFSEENTNMIGCDKG